jgi:signal transduction histidine kinase
MTVSSERLPVEPLFASRESIWLHVWLATQGTALAIALFVLTDGRATGQPASPGVAYSVVAIAALVAYHAAGYFGYDWLLRHTWANALFVPLGWVIVVATLRIGGGFSLLILGAILQGFIFLPFAWAVGTLTVVAGLLVTGILVQDSTLWSPFALARIAGVITTAVMIGTVFLYIHRVNRDAAVKARLLARLEEAQRDLADRARQAGVDEERQRFARDIHDTLAQGFSSVIRHLEAIELSFRAGGAADSPAVRDVLPHLAHAQQVSRESLDEIRRLVWALRPAALEASTLPAAMERIVSQWSDANGVAVKCAIESIPPLVPEAEVVLLRALQESLSNVARHAQAREVEVTLGAVDSLVMLSVEDDGAGFDDSAPARAGSAGLAGMRERVRPYGGRVLIDASVGAGTSITIALPLDAVRAPA